ncbi:MAG: class I SAM-dependent methyltransferase [Anaerolineales bacterium]|nr:class I SAM-dependent methyltransferase [Anaerolineales bacterium]
MTIDQAFNASIEYYDEWMRKALPNYSDLFRTAQERVPFPADQAIEVLDLGAGTGLFSKHILMKYPKAKFLLVDLADRMLDVARRRFAGRPDQFEYRISDYRSLQNAQEFDLVISSLSIHHLTDDEKQHLFRILYGRLRTPGVFLNIDQIRGETEYLRDLYWTHWLTQVRREEPSEERIRESIDRRKTYDRDALLEDQLRWLRDAGFTNVDCVYKNYFVGVFFAMKT